MTRGRRLLQERVRRVRVLFRELGYRTTAAERSGESYSAAFTGPAGAQGGLFIEKDSRFLEIGYTFSFSPSLADFVKARLEQIMSAAYEFGCYPNVAAGGPEIALSVFTKIYFSGLGYSALRDTLRDFNLCVEAITGILEIEGGDEDEGGASG